MPFKIPGIIFIIIFSLNYGYSQNLGVRGGLNLATTTGEGNNLKIGYQIGISGLLELSEELDLQP